MLSSILMWLIYYYHAFFTSQLAFFPRNFHRRRDFLRMMCIIRIKPIMNLLKSPSHTREFIQNLHNFGKITRASFSLKHLLHCHCRKPRIHPSYLTCKFKICFRALFYHLFRLRFKLQKRSFIISFSRINIRMIIGDRRYHRKPRVKLQKIPIIFVRFIHKKAIAFFIRTRFCKS